MSFSFSFRTLTLLSCLFVAGTGAATAADSLNDVLARMDQAAAGFKGMTAQMKRLDHTAVIQDTSEERGSVALRKTAKGVQILMDSTYPDKRTLSFQGRNLQIYLPKINTIQIYDLGKKRDQIDQFLVLGFGVSGKELQKQYTIKFNGSETVNGVKTSRVDLTPKSKEAQELFQHLELWVPESEGHAVQQKVYLRGGDYKLLTYSEIKINPASALGDSAFDLKAPKNAKKEYIGK